MTSWKVWFWVGVYTLMVLSLLTPLGTLFFSFTMVPLVILFSRATFRQVIVPMVLLVGMYYLFQPSMGLLMMMITLFLLLPALAMGKMNRLQMHAGSVIFTGFVIILGQLLLMLVIAYVRYDFNFILWFGDRIRDGFQSIEPIYALIYPDLDVSAQFLQLVTIVQTLFTTILLVVSVYLAWISYMTARWLLSNQGFSLPAFLPIREWRLPRSLIWYNIFAILLGFFVDDPSSFFYALYLNMFILLLLLFWLQGIGFLFFYTYHKKWSGFLAIIGVCLSIFSPVLYVFSIVGLLDLLFPLRKRISGS